MKTAVIASSDRDMYAGVLIAKLVKDGNAPDCVFCAEEPKSRQIRNYLRANGVIATVAKILDSLGLKASPANLTRHYLQEYAESQNLEFSESVSEQCHAHGIAYIPVASMNDSEAVTEVKSRQLDVLLTTGGEILRKPIIQSVTTGVFNAHSALLPKYRGYNVMEWSLLDNERIGITLHFIDVGIDTGDIIGFHEVPTEAGDTIATLRGKFFPVMVDAMSSGVNALVAGSLARQNQEPHEGEQYFAMHPRLKAAVEKQLAENSNSSS